MAKFYSKIGGYRRIMRRLLWNWFSMCFRPNALSGHVKRLTQDMPILKHLLQSTMYSYGTKTSLKCHKWRVRSWSEESVEYLYEGQHFGNVMETQGHLKIPEGVQQPPVGSWRLAATVSCYWSLLLVFTVSGKEVKSLCTMLMHNAYEH